MSTCIHLFTILSTHWQKLWPEPLCLQVVRSSIHTRSKKVKVIVTSHQSLVYVFSGALRGTFMLNVAKAVTLVLKDEFIVI